MSAPDEQFDEERPSRVTNAVLWTKITALEQQVSKLPTNSDVRVLVLAAVIAGQLIPNLNIQGSPLGAGVTAVVAWTVIKSAMFVKGFLS